MEGFLCSKNPYQLRKFKINLESPRSKFKIIKNNLFRTKYLLDFLRFIEPNSEKVSI